MNSTVVFPRKEMLRRNVFVGFVCVKGKSDRFSFLPLIMKHLNIHICGKFF